VRVGEFNAQGEQAAWRFGERESDGKRVFPAASPGIVCSRLDKRPIPGRLAAADFKYQRLPAEAFLGSGVIARDCQVIVAFVGLANLPENALRAERGSQTQSQHAQSRQGVEEF
jgi:hypothetical protein